MNIFKIFDLSKSGKKVATKVATKVASKMTIFKEVEKVEKMPVFKLFVT